MWDLIVSVPDHCLSFYFVCGYGGCMLVIKHGTEHVNMKPLFSTSTI